MSPALLQRFRDLTTAVFTEAVTTEDPATLLLAKVLSPLAALEAASNWPGIALLGRMAAEMVEMTHTACDPG